MAQLMSPLPGMDSPAPLDLAPIAKGKFVGNLESLRQNHYPDWFTHGKLGIWAHWGPQSVPMEGDWYARNLYNEGSNQYIDHLKRFGPPSEKGYKDIIPLWHAEKWNPDRLMRLYKKAGARYFVSMGVHHDNFDLWNSTYHRWNATKMGPKRDVVGTWQAAAKKQGLHFGVSEHLGASFNWFQMSRGADKKGAFAGVPYDGNDPAYQDLYHWAAKPGDTGWYSNDPYWHAEWYRRIKDLVDQYHPDLLYSDGGIPFDHVGESLVAHLYNTSMANHQGKQEAVYTCKQPSEGRWAQDVERGVMASIQTYPWQTDTSIGDWFYNKHWTYRGADWVIRTLVDVVSKNGNLLINVVQKPDGSLDPQAEKILADMAAWIKINGESVYNTTPWIKFGEGQIRAKGGAFKEDFGFTAHDVRYAQKGEGVVYATLMGRPSFPSITFSAFAKSASNQGKVRQVSVLGVPGNVGFTQTPSGLQVTLPDQLPASIAVVLKIQGDHIRSFTPSEPVVAAPKIVANSKGNFDISADLAELHGEGLNTETRDLQTNLGFWDSATDFATWNVDFLRVGSYKIIATVATENPATFLAVEVAGQRVVSPVPTTGGWGNFQAISLGVIKVAKPGLQVIKVVPAQPDTWKPINLRNLRLLLMAKG